jgi:hypothetical protein
MTLLFRRCWLPASLPFFALLSINCDLGREGGCDLPRLAGVNLLGDRGVPPVDTPLNEFSNDDCSALRRSYSSRMRCLHW